MGTVGRVVLAFVLALVAGWAGFQLWQRERPPAVTTTGVAPEPPGSAHLHLERGELDDAARAFAAQGDRLGGVTVAVARADAAWRRWRFGGRAPEALEALDRRVDEARHAVADLLRDCPDALRCAEGSLHARRLNVLLVTTFHEAGLDERARGALTARLEGSPEGALLARHLAAPPSASASAVPSASASAAPSPPMPPPTVAVPHPPEETFEFEEEPPVVPTTPDELTFPIP